MSDYDRSMIYAQVEPERIADVNWIMVPTKAKCS